MTDINFDIYQSPFSWRYGSEKMREIFSESNKRKTWRKVWIALAKAQSKHGLISQKELEDISRNGDTLDIMKAHEIEKEIKHDLMAELKVFAAQCGTAGGKIHLGATSQDIEDNADVINFLKALEIIEKQVKEILKIYIQKIEQYADVVCMAYTHLQPAEPTTLGYRFSQYAQDLLIDLELLEFIKKQIKGKGTKGAVGTYASYVSLLSEKADEMEEDVLEELGIDAFDVTSQVYPRKLDFLLLTLLSSIAQSLHKFAFDVRIMQSPGYGEWMEPFGKNQVGSSAMPFKRNPINAEKICSLSRYIQAQSKVAWDNAANSLLERTLDDSAARRLIIPDSFLATDEILTQAKNIIEGLVINENNIENNLKKYGPFSAIESILMVTVKSGADRQEMHQILREHAMEAYKQKESGNEIALKNNLMSDDKVTKYINQQDIEKQMNVKKHIGLAPQKAKAFAAKLKKSVS